MTQRGSLPRAAFLIAFFLLAACLRPGPPAGQGSRPDAAERPPPDRHTLDIEYAALVERYNARTGARQISYAVLQETLSRGDDVVLLDVREPDEHAVSALRGATLLPPSKVDSAALQIPAGATVVTYCTAGYRSGLAAVELEKRLGRPVFNLTGGIIEWFNRGGTVQDSRGKPVNRIHPFGAEWAKYVHAREP